MSEPQTTESIQPSCQVCRKQPGADGIILHNVSPPGLAWIWRCDEHIEDEHRVILRNRAIRRARGEDA